MAPQQYDPLPPPPPPPSWEWDRPPKSIKKMRPDDSQSMTATSSSSTTDTMATTTYTGGYSWPDEPSAAAISTKNWRPQYSGYPRPPPPPPGSRVSAAVWGAVGAVATLAILCLIGGCCLFFCRRARKRRDASRKTIQPQQMIKTNGQSMAFADTRAYAPSTTALPPPTLTSPSTASAPSTSNDEAPILLSTNIDRSYYTGIDTSDVISIVDHQRQSSYAASITEPPPPYRPTSIPSFSRENSCRASGAPPSYRPRLSIISPGNVVRSPFDDPEGESPVSELGTAADRESPIIRDMEEMSDVSELSYQQEPTQVRSSL